MFKALDDLVETRIRDAQARGDFDDLPGVGRPLPDEDLTGVPESLRVAFRILRNAGCVPPGVAALRDLDALLAQLGRETGPAAADDPGRRAGERRLLALTLALESQGLGHSARGLLEYRDRLVRRLGR
jgi:hypothetical protein